MDREKRLFISTLKKHGHSITEPRLRLFDTLRKHESLSINALIARQRKTDQSTVYRSLQLFERLGITTRLQLGNNPTIELSDIFHHHHHHLFCVSCRRVYALSEDPELESAIHRLSTQQEFRATDHQLEIRGLCKHCSKKDPSRID